MNPSDEPGAAPHWGVGLVATFFLGSSFAEASGSVSIPLLALAVHLTLVCGATFFLCALPYANSELVVRLDGDGEFLLLFSLDFSFNVPIGLSVNFSLPLL